MSRTRTDINITVQPWFKDHCFGGRAVLPAVETMQLLATGVGAQYPDHPVQSMRGGAFAKFFELPEGAGAVEALIELDQAEDGSVTAKLLSRKKLKSMTRIIEHGSVSFCTCHQQERGQALLDFSVTEQRGDAIPAEHIYRELVPFGPAYHTLKGDLHLFETYGWGYLQTPDFPLPGNGAHGLGSPFALDGALHGACVLGQQLVDYIPFPVGFTRRILYTPTLPDQNYIALIKLVEDRVDELVFDIEIFDAQKILCESVSGVRMRDVSRSISRN